MTLSGFPITLAFLLAAASTEITKQPVPEIQLLFFLINSNGNYKIIIIIQSLWDISDGKKVKKTQQRRLRNL